MKTPSNELFTLIKSLEPQEKGFFKVFSAKRSFNKNELSYLQLFDAIDKLKNYDEPLLKSKLKRREFKHHFKKAKSYLTEAILSSLEEYHSNISVNALLQKLLHRTEVLMKKKLNRQAKKILLKAETIALAHDRYDYLSVIYSMKEGVLRSTMDIKEMKDYIDHGIVKEKQYSEYLKNAVEFKNLAFQVRLIAAGHSKPTDEELVKKIHSIRSSAFLSSPDKALSFSARSNYYLIHLYCSQLLEKWDHTTYQRQKEWLTYLESDTIKLPERTHTYFSAFNNLMLIQINTGRRDEAEELYKKIKDFYFSLPSKKQTKELLSAFVTATSNYIGVQILNGNIDESLKAWEEIKRNASLDNFNPTLVLIMYNNAFAIYFMAGNYREALKWANKILNLRELNRRDMQAIARIYLLLIHYELGNYNMLPYLVKSYKRFLIKNNYFSEFEKNMIDFFENNIYKINSHEQQVNVFSTLKEQLKELFKNPAQTYVLEYFIITTWIGNKIKNSSFVKMVRP